MALGNSVHFPESHSDSDQGLNKSKIDLENGAMGGVASLHCFVAVERRERRANQCRSKDVFQCIRCAFRENCNPPDPVPSFKADFTGGFGTFPNLQARP